MNTDPRFWKHVTSEIVFRSPFLTLAEDTVVLPSGAESRWLRFEPRGDSVCVICRRDDGAILLANQYCHPSRRMVLEFPGGAVDPGEDTAEAARREVAEEVGIRAGTLRKLGSFLANNRRSSARMHVFLATDLTAGEAAPDPHESNEHAWYRAEAIEELIRNGAVENMSLLAAWALLKNDDLTRDLGDSA